MRRHLDGAVALLMLIGWVLACGGSSPAPPAVKLSAEVQFTGTQFTIKNTGTENWRDVELSVNDDYEFKTVRIDAGQSVTVGAMNVAKRDGTRFNPFTVKPQTAMIAATVEPSGQRRYYSGSWK